MGQVGRPRLIQSSEPWSEPATVQARVNVVQNAWLYRQAAKLGISRSEVIRRLINEKLEKL